MSSKAIPAPIGPPAHDVVHLVKFDTSQMHYDASRHLLVWNLGNDPVIAAIVTIDSVERLFMFVSTAPK